MTLEIIRESTGHQSVCSYLPDRSSTTRYRYIEGCSPETYFRMLERGWRRFGQVFFRPTCAGCGECRSLRVDVDRFRPSRSMRRNLAHNHDLEVTLQPASMTPEHLVLHERFHADMTQRKGWSEKPTDPFEYLHSFVLGGRDFGHELLYRADGRLLGVALVDILPQAISAVYCYYEPTERRRGIGVFSVLQHIALARSRGVPHVYLGYWVRDNASMSYKSRYRPHAVLRGRPSFDEEPVWLAADQPEPAEQNRPE